MQVVEYFVDSSLTNPFHAYSQIQLLKMTLSTEFKDAAENG